MFLLFTRLLFVFVSLFLTACSDNTPELTQDNSANDKPPEALESFPVDAINLEQLWLDTQTQLRATEATFLELTNSITHLLNTPNLENLTAAQQKWDVAAIHYSRFTIMAALANQNRSAFPGFIDLHESISAHPIQPGYLDSFGMYAYSGLVYDIDMPINETSLRQAHQMMDLADASIGLCAIEFILFGDKREQQAKAFIPIDTLAPEHHELGFTKIEELPQNRRRVLLQQQAELLQKDINTLIARWSERESESWYHNYLTSKKPLKNATALYVKQILSAITLTIAQHMRQLAELSTPDAHLQNAKPEAIDAARTSLLHRQAAATETILDMLNVMSLPDNKKAALDSTTQYAIDAIKSAATQQSPEMNTQNDTPESNNASVPAELRTAYKALSVLADELTSALSPSKSQPNI